MNIGVPITSLLIAPASISISLAADTFSGNNWPQAAGPPINSPPNQIGTIEFPINKSKPIIKSSSQK